FPPPALPGFVSTSDPFRHPDEPSSFLTMLEVRPPLMLSLPQLPRPPSLHAVLNTPVDWIRCKRWLLPCPCGLPRLIGGSASTTLLSRPAQALLALRPAKLLAHLVWAFVTRLHLVGRRPVSMLASYQT